MRECLYHPAHGYYSRISTRRFGDYYTSVDVHPIFGRLLARQFAEMWRHLGSPRPFVVAESAAGVGRLAAHILDFQRAHEPPEFYAALEYVAVGAAPAAPVRAEHAATPRAACWRLGEFRSAAEIPSASISNGQVAFSRMNCWMLLVAHRVVMESGEFAGNICGTLTTGYFTDVRGKPIHASAAAIF